MSQVEVPAAKLALERAADCRILFNGAGSNGCRRVVCGRGYPHGSAPGHHAGENTLEVTVPIGRRVGAEAMALLGDFGVRVSGAKTELIQPVKSLCFGDYKLSGLAVLRRQRNLSYGD